VSILSAFGAIFKRCALAISRRRTVAGITVWHLLPTDPEGSQEFGKTAAAIQLIHQADPRRFAQMKRDLRGIWIIGVSTRGEYDHSLRMCKVDSSFLLRPDITVEDVAATLVHESTHARLARYGFGYAPAIRPRLERLCLNAEIAFAAHLPNGSTVVANAERLLTRLHDAWTDEAMMSYTVRRLRALDAPEWLVRWLQKRRTPAA